MGIEEARHRLQQVQDEIMNRRGGRPLVPPERRNKSSELHLKRKKLSPKRQKCGREEVVKVEYSEKK